MFVGVALSLATTVIVPRVVGRKLGALKPLNVTLILYSFAFPVAVGCEIVNPSSPLRSSKPSSNSKG